MPNLPDTTTHSQRRGGRCYGDEWGGKREKVWWNWREREDKNRRHIVKNVRFKLFTQKNTKITLFCKEI